jgi:tRNA(Leu) C34 or U34 (ribose-2'-O)-methylase TrmL
MYNVDQHGLDPEAFVEAQDPKGQKFKVSGVSPAIILCDPKYPHNLGQVVRACSAFDVKQLWWTGSRVLRELETMDRIPREERMRGYGEVKILHSDRPLDAYRKENVTPVAVEFRPGSSEELPHFHHPENPVYLFGPEDGGINQATLAQCHRFVFIPMKHCANLAAAVYMVLYDRMAKTMKG